MNDGNFEDNTSSVQPNTLSESQTYVPNNNLGGSEVDFSANVGVQGANPIQTTQMQNDPQKISQPQIGQAQQEVGQTMQFNSSQSNTTETQSNIAGGTVVDVEKINIWPFLLAFLTKPMTVIGEEKHKFIGFRNVGIITAVISALYGFSSLISTIISKVYFKKCSLYSGECKTGWKWDNLKDAKLFNTFVTGMITVVIAVAIVSLAFFAVSRFMKQNKTNYSKMMTILMLSSLPIVLASVASQILKFVNTEISILISTAGFLYGGYIAYEGINDEVQLSGDKKVYYNTISILAMALLFYVMLRLILGDKMYSMLTGGGFNLFKSMPSSGSSSSDFESILDMLK